MEFKDLIKRGLEIRAKYAQLEIKNNGKAWGVEQIAQGFVGDVGDLAKLVMAKNGWRNIEGVDEKIKHELADCLWSLLVIADKYDINLEESFVKTMDQLDAGITLKLSQG